MRRRSILRLARTGLAAGVLCASALTQAQSPGPRPVWAEEPLTLGRCVELALQDGLTVQALRARVQAAEAAVTTAQTPPNPVFTYTAQDLGLVTPSGLALLHQQALSLPILAAYTRQKEAQVVRAALAQVSASAAEERRQLRRAVGRAYLDAVLAERLAELDARAERLAAELIGQATRRMQHGEAGAIEITRAHAEALDVQRSAQGSRRRSEQARLALSTWLGAELPFLVRLAVAPTSPVVPVVQEAAPSEAAQDPQDPSARADLVAAQAAVARAARQVELEARRQLPLADLQLVAGARESAAGVGGLLALSVPVPLWDHNRGPLRLARAQLEGARAEHALRTRQVALELASTERERQGTRDVLDQLARPLVPLREQALRAAQRQFAEGLVPLLEVITAQRDLLQAERALAQAERDAAVAEWELRIARAAD
ncbi:MAG: TolC family protein [Polyangia bacterium]